MLSKHKIERFVGRAKKNSNPTRHGHVPSFKSIIRRISRLRIPPCLTLRTLRFWVFVNAMSFSADVNIAQAMKCVSDALRLDSDNRVKVNMHFRKVNPRARPPESEITGPLSQA